MAIKKFKVMASNAKKKAKSDGSCIPKSMRKDVKSGCTKKSVKASDTAKKFRVDIYKKDNPDALVKREVKTFNSEDETKKYGESIANGGIVNVIEVKASRTKKSVKASEDDFFDDLPDDSVVDPNEIANLRKKLADKARFVRNLHLTPETFNECLVEYEHWLADNDPFGYELYQTKTKDDKYMDLLGFASDKQLDKMDSGEYSYYVDWVRRTSDYRPKINASCTKKSVKSSKSLTVPKSKRKSVKASYDVEYIEQELAEKSGKKSLLDAYDRNELTVVVKDGAYWFEHTPSRRVSDLAKKEMKRLYPEIEYLYDIKSSKSTKKFRVKASNSAKKRVAAAKGYWADDINAENYRKILKALDDYLIANYDGKTIGDVEIGVSELRNIKDGKGSKIEVEFYSPDYEKDTKLEIISAPDLRSKFLCRVSVDPFKFDEKFEIPQSGSKQIVVDKINEIANRLSGSAVESSCKTKKTVKASAAAKRRNAIKASGITDDIVIYFNGDNVYQGSIYDMADAIENLCYDDEVNAKFQEWCNQFGDPFDFDGSPIDTARVFTDIIIHEAEESPVSEDGQSEFYEDGDGILDFEILYADDIYGAKSIKCTQGDFTDDFSEDGFPFRVTSYYDHSQRGIADGASFDDMDEAVAYAHEKLSEGPVRIEHYDVGAVDINPDEYWENFDGEFWCTPELAEWRDEVWKSMGIGASTNITCEEDDDWEDIREVAYQDSYEYDGYDDGDIVEYLDQYFNRFNDVWLYADYVDYNSPDDWSVSASLGSDSVGSDFNYFLEEHYPELYNTLNETRYTEPDDPADRIAYDLLDVITPNDFFIEFYPNNNQWSAPQIDIDTNDKQLKAQLEEARSAYEANRIESYKAIQDGLGEFLANGITASTDIKAANSLNLNAKPNYTDWMLRGYKFDGEDVTTLRIDFQDDVKQAVMDMFADPDIETVDLYKIPTEQETTGVFEDEEYFTTFTREDINSSVDIEAGITVGEDSRFDFSNPIYELDDYVKAIADGVVNQIQGITYDISKETIAFFDADNNVVFVQPIGGIIPEPDDLETDIDELSAAIQSEMDNAYGRDNWEQDNDDPDYASRAIELSEDIGEVDIDDLEPITGEGEDTDYGFGFDSNGNPIDESTVEELERIAQEVLDKSEIHSIDEYVDPHNFNYYASIPYIQESFDISFTYVADIYELSKNGMATDEGYYTTVAPYNIHFNVRCKNGEVEYAECTDIDINDGYVKDVELKNFNLDALVQFATDLVNPVAMDIYNATTNI